MRKQKGCGLPKKKNRYLSAIAENNTNTTNAVLTEGQYCVMMMKLSEVSWAAFLKAEVKEQMSSDYETLLDRAYSKLPDTLKEHSRFVTPKVVALIQGKTTFLKNLGEISKAVNREPDVIAKYLIREFGTSGTYDSQHLSMKGQFRLHQIQEKFEAFLAQYVICPECGRPDTKIMQERRISFLKCEACGSRHPLAAIKTTVPKDDSKKIAIGDEITVQITRTGKRGDGMALLGQYVVFVTNAREGQKARARITGMQGTRLFANAIEILK